MINLHKSRRNCILIFVIVCILGMCFDSYQTDSSLCSFIQTDSVHFHSNQIKVSANNSACTQEMLQGRVYSLFEHFFSRSTNAENYICKPDYNLNSNIFLSLSQGFYSVYSIILFCPELLDKNIVKYLHKSDGKKRL